MPYEHTTLATARSRLAERLDDPGNIHWAAAELDLALAEALRLFNCLTGHFRARGAITTAANDAFYPLPETLVDVDDGVTLLREQTVTDRQLVSEIEYHLVEPQGLSAWAGTDQFTLPQVLGAIERRRNQFLAETGCVVTEDSVAVPSSANGRITLEDDIITVRRAVLVDGGTYYPLRPSDERSATSLRRGFSTPGPPTSFSVASTPQLVLQIYPPPPNTSSLEILVVRSGPALDTTANGGAGTILGIPDDLAWAVKWGALSDLLRGDASTDLQRADECEELYRLGVQLAKQLPVVLHVEIAGRPVLPAALYQTDILRRAWQGLETGRPGVVSTAGPDLVAVTPVPDGAYQVQLDVVRRARVPSLAADYVEVGEEHLEAVLGYAQHVSTFKLAGEEHTATRALADNFFRQAAGYSYRRAAVSSMLASTLLASTAEGRLNPPERLPRSSGEDPQADEVRQERNSRRRSTVRRL